MNATKTQQKTKLKNVDDITLNELVSLAYHRCSPVGEVSEITQFLRKEFKVDVSNDDSVILKYKAIFIENCLNSICNA